MPTAIENVLARLWAVDCEARGNAERGWSAKCPAHDDRNPSLSIGLGAEDRVLIHCHRGCTLEEIAAAAQLDLTELFEPETKPADPAAQLSIDGSRLPERHRQPPLPSCEHQRQRQAQHEIQRRRRQP